MTINKLKNNPLATFLSGFLILGLTVFAGCSSNSKKEKKLTIFAGSAIKLPLQEIRPIFKEETGISLNLNFGGSGTMLSRMEMSGRGDLFIPGSPEYIDIAREKELIKPNSTRKIAYLVPGILVPAGNPADIRELQDLTNREVRVGLANPKSVVIGRYSLEVLEHNKLLEEVLNNVVTVAGSAAQTANLVAQKQVDAVIGWEISARWNPERIERIKLSPGQIPRVSYLAAATGKNSAKKELIEKFMNFLNSPPAVKIFEKYEYILSEESARSRSAGGYIGGNYELPDRYLELMETGE
ncbi:MAG: molybdate ABC transporter substrate-binding protein [bacterium]